ncbi:hypothetical protein D3C78_1518030 [compost metagenome]
MDRLIHGLALAGLGVRCAERGGRQHTERAGEHGGDVGEHVAKEIVGDDHVELLGLAHQLHAAGIGQHMFQLNVLELGGMGFGDHLVPQNA